MAGAAALYKASHPSASPATVKQALQAAGNLGWNDTDDPDGVQGPLRNVASFSLWLDGAWRDRPGGHLWGGRAAGRRAAKLARLATSMCAMLAT